MAFAAVVAFSSVYQVPQARWAVIVFGIGAKQVTAMLFGS